MVKVASLCCSLFHDEGRALQKVLEGIEDECGVIVVVFLEFELEADLQIADEVGQGGHAARELPDEHVARHLVALHSSAVALLERRVPYTDAVHGHDLGMRAQTVLDIVGTHEDG